MRARDVAKHRLCVSLQDGGVQVDVEAGALTRLGSSALVRFRHVRQVLVHRTGESVVFIILIAVMFLREG